MDEILKLLNTANGISASLSAIVPEIEAAYNAIKGTLGSHDDAAVRQQIDALHVQISNNRAALDALRDPPAPVAPVVEKAKAGA